MSKFKIVIHSVILATTPSFLVYPQEAPLHADFHVQTAHSRKLEKNFRKKERYHLVSYDDLLRLFEEIESGKAEKKYREKDIKRINDYLAYLAGEGKLPNSDALALREDIEDLLYGDDDFECAFTVGDEEGYSIISAVYHDQANIILCKSKLSKKWEKTKRFIKKHKKEIIIGAVIVVATAAIIIAVIAVPSAGVAAAAGAAGAAASSRSNQPQSNKSGQKQEESSFSSGSIDVDFTQAPIFEAELDYQKASFKDKLVAEEFFQNSNFSGQYEELSWEETGRVLGPLFAHESVNEFQSRLPIDPQLAREIQNVRYKNHLPMENESAQQGFNHLDIDKAFSTDYSSLFANQNKVTNFNALSYHMRGEEALKSGYYNQAVCDLGKAIELNPTDPMSYLQRSASYFNMGQYDHSLEDFHAFTEQVSQEPKIHPLSVSEFSLGFAKGLPKGVYESGEGILLFLADFVTHPIHTSTQMVEALSTLANLARNDQWGIIGEVLSPEIHQLVTQWDTLPSDKRGELAGYAFGKHGADIAAPGALAKVASKSVKSAQELAAVFKNLQRAERTLVLETAAGMGNGAKIAEIVEGGQRTAFLAEELGFTAREMGQLKQAGKLEGTVSNRLESLSNNPIMRQSFELFDKAQDFLKPYKKVRPQKVLAN